MIAHGLLGDQLDSERDFAEAERILAANFLSVVALLVPLGNHFEAAGGGNIAVMSSVAGDRGRPRNYTYGASKGALNVYLQGLRTRLWSRGVRVQTLKLGPVDTPMTTTHKKTRCSPATRPPPPASSPPSTPAAPKPTSPGSGARSWPSSATSRSACCNTCRRCRDASGRGPTGQAFRGSDAAAPRREPIEASHVRGRPTGLWAWGVGSRVRPDQPRFSGVW